jgi:hypothetical protein
MIIICYTHFMGGVLLLSAALMMWTDGHIFLPLVCALAGAMFLWDSIDRDDDDDDTPSSSLLLVR